MDKILEHLWESQKDFNQNFVDFDKLDFEKRQDLTKDYILHMISETNSLLEEINWKMHHKKIKDVNRRELILEWIDVFKYWLSIGLVWGITESEFLRYFDEKSLLVAQRYFEEFKSIDPSKKVVICDIDGILGDYPHSFLEFVKRRVQEDEGVVPDFSTAEVDSLNLYKYLEGVVDPIKLKQYKKEYRQSGVIRKETTMPGAVNFLETLKSKGYFLVLLTSRPFHEYKNLHLDTLLWLKSNGLVFDSLISDNKKRDEIIRISENYEIVCVIDDDSLIVNGIKDLICCQSIYLMDRLYNRDLKEEGIVKRVKSFDEIIELLDKNV